MRCAGCRASQSVGDRGGETHAADRGFAGHAWVHVSHRLIILRLLQTFLSFKFPAATLASDFFGFLCVWQQQPNLINHLRDMISASGAPSQPMESVKSASKNRAIRSNHRLVLPNNADFLSIYGHDDKPVGRVGVDNEYAHAIKVDDYAGLRGRHRPKVNVQREGNAES